MGIWIFCLIDRLKNKIFIRKNQLLGRVFLKCSWFQYSAKNAYIFFIDFKESVYILIYELFVTQISVT